MTTYLKVVNPIVAVLVLAICLFAAFYDDGEYTPENVLNGGVPPYFVAKGLFCSSALFILGKILLVLIGGASKSTSREP